MGMGKISFFLALICGLGLARTGSADTYTYTLENVGPYGTVVLSGTDLPAGYQSGVDVVAGMLEFNKHDNNNGNDHTGDTLLYTYCIDVASIISFGGQWSTTLASLAAPELAFTQTQQYAIENLFNNNLAGFTTPLVPIVNGAAAGNFQVALWDIIYNSASLEGGSPSNANSTALSYSSPGGGVDLNPTDTGAAFKLAYDAYSLAKQQVNHTQAAPANNVETLLMTDGQNQAHYLVGGGPLFLTLAVPTPLASWGGLCLLGLLTLGKFRRLFVASA